MVQSTNVSREDRDILRDSGLKQSEQEDFHRR